MSASVQTPPAVTTPLDSASLAVRAFVAAHDLTEHVTAALQLAATLFPVDSGVTLQLEEDPDVEGKWVVMDWLLHAPGGEALRCYQRFVTEWNTNSPPWVGNLLRVTFHLA